MRRIVILGAGYAGVRAVQELKASLEEREVWLIDRHRGHEVLTEMYKVAAGDRKADRVEIPLHRLLPHHRNLKIVQADIDGLDWRKREVLTSRGAIAYETVLICLGATPEYFHIPGAREHALTLQYLDSAVRLRRRLDRLARQGGRHVVIVGGGLTGVEIASEIASSHPGRFHLTLAQAKGTILPEEDPKLAAYAERVLDGAGIDVRRGEPVKRVLPRSVELQSGAMLPADLVIWTGGVRGNPLPKAAGLPVDERGRVKVRSTLEVEGHPELFAAGDVAAVPGADGHVLPPTAQLAVQEGLRAARNIVRVMAGEEPKPLRARILGMAASLGGGRGIAHVGRFRLKGRAGHLVHELALLRYLYGIGGLGLLSREGYLSWTHPPAAAPRPTGADAGQKGASGS